MAEPAPRVVAVVLNFRLPKHTLQCVADLQANVPPPALHVIDNGSGDGSALELGSVLGPDVLEVLDTNVGYCAAVNRGIHRARSAGAHYVLLINNDVRIGPEVVSTLTRFLDVDPTVAGVAPSMLREDGRVWAEGGEVRMRSNLAHLRRAGQPPTPTTAGPAAVPFQPGACTMYRLTALEVVGDLDPAYFMYWEDADLGRRLWAAGFKVVHLPWVRVVHAGGQSSGGGRSPLRKYLLGLNSVRYLRRHGSLRLWLAFLLLDCLLWPLALISGTGPRAGFAKARGIAAGLCGRQASAADVERFLPRGHAPEGP